MSEEGVDPAPICPVCLDVEGNGEPFLITVCGHRFCEGCLMRWLSQANTCPVCRNQILEPRRRHNPQNSRQSEFRERPRRLSEPLINSRQSEFRRGERRRRVRVRSRIRLQTRLNAYTWRQRYAVRSRR